MRCSPRDSASDPARHADASIAVLAARHRASDVLTLDERHFRVLRAGEAPFRLLPSDA
jgi:predicted nucleic acid-binding protein